MLGLKDSPYFYEEWFYYNSNQIRSLSYKSKYKLMGELRANYVKKTSIFFLLSTPR